MQKHFTIAFIACRTANAKALPEPLRVIVCFLLLGVSAYQLGGLRGLKQASGVAGLRGIIARLLAVPYAVHQ